MTPLSGIPGLSSLIGITVALISAQMVLGRRCFCLPSWIARRRMPRKRLDVALRWLRGPARTVDAVVAERLNWVFVPAIVKVIEVCCLTCGLSMPFLDLVPLTSSILGDAVALFAVALISRDGLLALIGLAAMAGAYGLLDRLLGV